MYSQQNIPPQGSAAAMQMRINSTQPQQQHQQQQQQQQQQNGTVSQHNLQPSFPDTTKFVLDYMKKRGFSRSETESRLENAKYHTPPITLNNPLSVQYEVPNAANVPKFIRTPSGATIPIGGPIAGPLGKSQLLMDSKELNWFAYNALQEFLLSASEDKTVRLWSLETYQGLVSYKSHNDPVWDVQFSPLGHYFATASNDQTARLWSTDRIYPLRIFAGHLSDVDNVIFHPNGKYIVTGSHDRTARMWDINTGSVIRIFPGHTKPISSTAISPDGRWLATASEDSMIYVWDLGSSRRIKSMRGHGKCSIYSLAFSPDGDTLVSAGSDCTVRVWDVRKNTYDQGPEPEPFGAALGADASSAGTAPGRSGSVNGKVGSISGPSGGGKLDGLFDLGGKRKKEIMATPDHLVVYNTRKTPVYKVKYTKGSMCIAGGVLTE